MTLLIATYYLKKRSLILVLDYYFFQFSPTRDMGYILNTFIYTKLFWYDGEQGNDRCLCLSHIFNVILSMGGVFLPHT